MEISPALVSDAPLSIGQPSSGVPQDPEFINSFSSAMAQWTDPPDPPPAAESSAEEAVSAPNAPPQTLDLPRNAQSDPAPQPSDPDLPPVSLNAPVAVGKSSSESPAKKPVSATDKVAGPQTADLAQQQQTLALEVVAAAPIVASSVVPPKPLSAVNSEVTSVKPGPASKAPASNPQDLEKASPQASSNGAPTPQLPIDTDVPIVSVQQASIAPSPSMTTSQAPSTVSGQTPASAKAEPLATTVPISGQSLDSQGGSPSQTGGEGAGYASGESAEKVTSVSVAASGSQPSNEAFSAVQGTTAVGATIATKPADLESVQGLDRTALVKQVADKVSTMLATNQRNGVTIQLSPKDLGSIVLTVKSLGSSLDTQIVASNDHVRAALEQSRPELAHAMQSRGYHLTGMQVSTGADSSAQSERQAQQQHAKGQSSNARAGSNSESTDLQPDPETADLRRKLTGVDVWI